MTTIYLYLPCYITGPLMPGEYRHLPDDAGTRVCCAGCAQVFDLPAGATPRPPDHVCDGSAREDQ